MFGDFEDRLEEVANRLLEIDSFGTILYKNDLKYTDVLILLIEAGLIDTSNVE